VAKAYAGLDAGRTLDDVLSDMGILVALGLLHPRTPEHVARVLREGGRRSCDQRRPSAEDNASSSEGVQTPLSAISDRQLLGLGPEARPDEIEVAHRKAILACHPDRFAAVPPAVQRLMNEVTARINVARARLLGSFGQP
jgi:hypothetical protein